MKTVPLMITGYPNAIAKPDPTKKGELAGQKVLFGDHKRYAVAPVHSRFGSLTWFVWDADKMNEDGNPDVIRQEETFEDAIKGLE